MKDSKEKELEVGQKVAYAHGGDIVTGTVARVRTGKRYGRDVEVCRITLDTPVQRRRYIGYETNAVGQPVIGANGTYTYRYEDMPPILYYDCRHSSKVLVLDNSTD